MKHEDRILILMIVLIPLTLFCVCAGIFFRNDFNLFIFAMFSGLSCCWLLCNCKDKLIEIESKETNKRRDKK